MHRLANLLQPMAIAYLGMANLLAPWAAASAGATKLPPWAPTWEMNMSTIMMPCNYSGYMDPEFCAR